MTRKNTRESAKAKRSTVLPREVKIIFDGLFYFSFPDSKETAQPYTRDECVVGVLSTRADHLLYVTYSTAGSSKCFMLPHQLLSGMPREIEIYKDNGPNGVTIRGAECIPRGWGKPNNRYEKTPVNEKDFNWIIDFEGDELHAENINEKTDKLRPKLRIKTGDFFTEKVTDYKYYIFQEGIPKPFGYVAQRIGAEISLDDTDTLMIKAGNKIFPLPQNVTTIYLENLPPEHKLMKYRKDSKPRADNQHDAAIPLHHPNPDHTQIYYDEVLEIDDQKKRFYFIPEIPEPLARNLPFICFTTGGSRRPSE